MKFLVVGCGSIGQRHIRNLKSLGYEISGCEKDVDQGEKVKKLYGIEIFNDLNKALIKKYDVGLICTPTSLHIPMAIELAKRGINLFIEKPLSNNMDGIGELLELVTQKNLTVLVGCNTRFSPKFKLAKKLIDENKIGKILSVKVSCGFYLPYWHPWEDYRKGYSANKCLGGGVIFDDIHEIDALCWLFGEVKEVFCFADKISNLEIDTEDIAEIFLRFRSGVIAQIHLDYLQRTYRRYYEFIGEKGVIVWDYIKQTVELYSEETNHWEVFQESINTTREQMFIDEIKHLINCIEGKENSINDLLFSKNVLELTLACHESARKKEIVYL